LLQPETFPESTANVELKQTQMSFVFLTDNYVYKIKKPINLGYLDYTTLKNRLYYCNKEIELNKRLCPDSYLGVVSINNQQDIYSIGGPGRVIEYAVKMHRLPQQLMMDTLLDSGKVTIGMINRLANKIATFHKNTETNKEISTFGKVDTIIKNTEENFNQTIKYIDRTISKHQYEKISKYCHYFISKNNSLFEKRIEEKRIKDCHGDLHTAHICFKNGICIYDCIEFNDRFRYCDVASEIAFLAMDIDYYGHYDLSLNFIDAYIKNNKDNGIEDLLGFYKCYRAYVRGKVESFKLDDPLISKKDKTRVLAIAQHYFDLAESYIQKSILL
jgi:aminoglycoside phosphotransferase family enzyme